MTGKQKHIIAKVKSFIEAYFKAEYNTLDFPYHDIEHTRAVVRSAEFLCESEGLDSESSLEVIVAAWFHDVGYVNDPENHENIACLFLQEFLIDHAINDIDQQRLHQLIQATNLVTPPTNLAQKIIKDADLHYLGSHAYLENAEHLRTEWKRIKGVEYTDEEWYQVNIDFFQFHQFYTASAISYYQPIKDENYRVLQNQIDQESNV